MTLARIRDGAPPLKEPPTAYKIKTIRPPPAPRVTDRYRYAHAQINQFSTPPPGHVQIQQFLSCNFDSAPL